MHESGENFGVTTGRFSEIWKRRGMKVNAGKSSVVKRWKRKDRKSRKSRSEEKAVAFSSASVFLSRKQEAVTQGGTIQTGGIYHLTRRKTQGAGIVKGW